MLGEHEKMIRDKILFKIFKERPSKLEKGYSQALVKQTVGGWSVKTTSQLDGRSRDHSNPPDTRPATLVLFYVTNEINGVLVHLCVHVG